MPQTQEEIVSTSNNQCSNHFGQLYIRISQSTYILTVLLVKKRVVNSIVTIFHLVFTIFHVFAQLFDCIFFFLLNFIDIGRHDDLALLVLSPRKFSQLINLKSSKGSLLHSDTIVKFQKIESRTKWVNERVEKSYFIHSYRNDIFRNKNE